MDQLFKALPSVLKGLGPNGQADEAMVHAAWVRCAGQMLNERTHALEFFENRLIVAVEDNTWRRHLEELSPRMLVSLNAALGEGTVRFIEFRIDPAEIKAAGKMRSKDGEVSDPAPVSPAIRSAAEAIADDDLRERFIEAASSSLNKRT
jgi:hypothetical protein